MHSLSTMLRAPIARQVFSRQLATSSIRAQQEKKLEGRVALMLACTDGIGYQMAKRLADDGAHVVLGSRKQANVDAAVNKLKSEGLSKVSGSTCHVGDADQRNAFIRKAAEEHGGFDIILNNAGVNAHKGSFLSTPDSAFDKAFDVNVKANFCLVRDSLPYMKNRKHQGAIVLTSSVTGYRASDYPGAYAVSKLAIVPLVHALAPELYKHNIRINCLTLGLFKTAFADVMIGSDAARDHYTSYSIMKRIADPVECGPIASFLCSDDSSYVTGENICVTGGVFARL